MLPETPVRSTNANGITEYDLYETTYSLPYSATVAPTVTASSDNDKVKISITQADSPTGVAKIAFDYDGVVKTYQVKFEKEPEEMHVYLCLGQSNMEGHVRVNPEFEPDVDSRFRVLQAVDCPNLGRVKGVV